jgi:hypothetical protein
MSWRNFEKVQSTDGKGVCMMASVRICISSFVLPPFRSTNYEARIRLGCLHLRKSFPDALSN